jgi:acetolactate synthase small subunit
LLNLFKFLEEGMPQRKNLTWGEIPKQRVRRLLEVLLDADDNDHKLLKVEWQEGQRDRYCLVVHYTTKANLVKLITGNPYPSEKKKAEIQDAIAHLEELQILTDLRPVKTGAKAKNLSFSLDLPVQSKSEVMQLILETKWLSKSDKQKNNIKTEQVSKTEEIGNSHVRPTSSIPDYEVIAEIEQQGNQKIVRWQIKLRGKLENFEPESITKIQTIVNQIAGDDRQTIMNITDGSIIVEFAGSEAGFKKILDLFNRGELTEIAGFPVEAVEAIEQVADPVHLSQWQQDIFPAAWQAIASLLSSAQMQLAFGWRSDWEPEIIRGHEINLAATSLALVVGLATENEAKTRICLQLHPTPQQNYLPPNLQLILLDERKNPVLATATENDTSRFLQLDFRGDVAEPFAVKISLENDIITKNFVI